MPRIKDKRFITFNDGTLDICTAKKQDHHRDKDVVAIW